MRILIIFIFIWLSPTLLAGELDALKNNYSVLESYSDHGEIDSYEYKDNKWVKVSSGEFETEYIKNGKFKFVWRNEYYSGKIIKDESGVLFYSNSSKEGERKTIRNSLVAATGVSGSSAIVVPPMLLGQNFGVHTKKEVDFKCTKISTKKRVTILGGIGCTDIFIDLDGFIEKTIQQIEHQGRKFRTVLSYKVKGKI